MIDTVVSAGWELTPENIKEAERQILAKRNGVREIFKENRIISTRIFSVLGGVDLKCEISVDQKYSKSSI